MKVEILGASGCKRCSKLKDNIEEMVVDMNLSNKVEVEKIDDPAELAKRGIMETPAVYVDGDLKVKGRALDEDEIREILK